MGVNRSMAVASNHLGLTDKGIKFSCCWVIRLFQSYIFVALDSKMLRLSAEFVVYSATIDNKKAGQFNH
jgi:hypothetical protein